MISYRPQPHERAVLVKVLATGKPSVRLIRHADGTTAIEAVMVKRPSRRDVMMLMRKIIMFAKKEEIADICVDMTQLKSGLAPKELGEVIALNMEIANYAFTKYKTPPKEGWPKVASVAFVGKHPKPFWDGIAKGAVIGEEMNKTRDLANTPGGDMTPETLAKSALEAVAGLKVKVTILSVEDMQKKGMGAILGVGKGSDAPPKFIIMEYKGGDAKKPIVLVGKGVTFDTGGLNLKPGNSINEMHMDMSGGAAVIHAVATAARLKLRTHVIGLVPAVENMPSGSSYRPGDVLRSMSGKTIEIGNTDAEGRVILADALTYAESYSPRLVIDVATLTGAASVALGDKCSALFSKSDTLAKKLIAMGEETGDRLWQLPLWDEYEDGIKGMHGDWSNIGAPGKGAGAINGGIFLYQFAKNYPWAHIDIAPRMTTNESDNLAKGASGEPLRLLVRILERL